MFTNYTYFEVSEGSIMCGSLLLHPGFHLGQSLRQPSIFAPIGLSSLVCGLENFLDSQQLFLTLL